MKPPDLPPDETHRLCALDELKLLDTPPEERFDRLTRLAARTFDIPIALVSLIDSNRQWFKSRHGLEAPETARDISFCGHAILREEPLVIENALNDERFVDNPLVTGEPNIRFYAGAPLHDRHGHRVGTLCVIDRKPRSFSDEDKATLRDLADLVEREFGLGELGNFYDERNRALNILTEIALDTQGDASQRVTRALEMACNYLGLETGIVSRITGGAYTVHWHFTHLQDTLTNGTTIPLERTYCSLMVATGQVLAIDHMGQSAYRNHICYQVFGLESYLAAPIWIDGEIFGTINISSRHPRPTPFTATERMFVTLLARWVADTIYQQQHTETLNKLVTQTPGMLYQYRLWPNGHSSFPYTSPGIQDIYGVSGEEVAADASPVFDRIHPDDLAGVAESIQRSAESLEQWQHQYRIRWKTGGWHWVEGLARPEPLPDGSILWHGYISDVHERHKIDEMKNQFISTVSHELRTPLTSISGSLGLILGGATGPLTQKTTQMLDIARRNTDQLRRLIDDLLDIEKLVTGNMTIDASVQDLESAVRVALEEIQPLANQHNIEIQLSNANPGVRASFDGTRLTQALSNLLSNAIKFSPEGDIVDVGIRQSGTRIRLEVRDRGPGVPETFRDRIFQKFAQANASSSRSKEGTGLGLAITRELMHAMGGEVGFDSEEGKGACFWLSLPLADADNKGAT
ncbi:histidine kinase [Marinobacter sp. EhC06]|jgi:PAS domain S-box-containing protein|uniref:GAF domain-containing protein n=1 Tax=Marinobacter TaxID=2742 RepID=UPI0007D9BA0F|nr:MULTISPECIES: GAF domain-containing protein [unclassified Marinobacter]OAN88646.1 histidine kinase [Marinobacter sp. EhN04]OAN91628.1 histidine kinase [Marinobacter sp. EhC06]